MERIYKTTIVTLFLLTSFVAKAQVVNDDIAEKYPFINLSADTLIYDKNSPKMKAFFKKCGAVVSLKRGNVNIYVLYADVCDSKLNYYHTIGIQARFGYRGESYGFVGAIYYVLADE